MMDFSLYGMNLVDCGNSGVYNSQLVIKIKRKNDSQPQPAQTKKKPYFHQISLDCIEKLVECIERFNKGEIDTDTSFLSKH